MPSCVLSMFYFIVNSFKSQEPLLIGAPEMRDFGEVSEDPLEIKVWQILPSFEIS